MEGIPLPKNTVLKVSVHADDLLFFCREKKEVIQVFDLLRA